MREIKYQARDTKDTGLHDKNGKEIYEGDILSFASNYARSKNGKYLPLGRIVEFIDGSFCIDHLPISGGNFLAYEVIGNIYENPKLLEAK